MSCTTSYDRWFRAKVQEALDDPRPGIPHDEAIARLDAIIAHAKARKPRALPLDSFQPNAETLQAIRDAAEGRTIPTTIEGIRAMILDDDEAPVPIQEITLTATPSNGNSQPFTLNIYFDPECNSFWAESPDIDGLCVSGENVQDVQQESCLAAELLLELQYDPEAKTYTATSPNLPGLVAEAKSKDELMQAVSDCVDLLTR